MSLINRMLQDLEARHAEPLEATIFPSKIHAVPGERRSALRWWGLSLGLVIALLIGAWLLWRSWPAKPVAAPPLVITPASNPVLVPSPAPVAATKPVPIIATPTSSPATSNSVAAVENKPIEPAAITPAAKAPEPVVVAAEPSRPVNTPDSPPTPKEPLIIPKPAKDLTAKQRADEIYQKALLSLQQGRLDEGRAGLEEALQLNPANMSVRQAMLGVLVENKQYDKAIAFLQNSLTLFPQQSGFAMALARLQVERGETNAALQTLERYQSHAQENAEYHAFKGTLLQREGRHKEAIVEYQAALRVAPQTGVWLIGLAISLEADKQFASARDVYRRAQQTPLSAELYTYSEQRLAKLQETP